MQMNENKRPRSALKTYFAKNMIPTEQQFAQLIDSGINQRDDGVHKNAGDPLSIEAAGDDTSLKRAVNFYLSFADADPAWSVALKARSIPAVPATARVGLSVLDAGGTPRLTIDAASGNVGVGTVEPKEKLEVAGRVRAGNMSVGPWPADGNYGFVGVNTLDQSQTGNYALLQGSVAAPGVTFLNSPTSIRLRIANREKVTIDDSGITMLVPLQVNSTLTPSAGQGGGIVFPPNPGGGGGDSAWMRYFSRGGESMTLEIGTSNDPDDHISLMPSGNVGVGTLEPKEKLEVAGRVRAGNMTVGPWPADGNHGFVGVNTLDQSQPGNYALLQGSTSNPGVTFLNSPSAIRLRLSNADKVVIDGGGVTMSVPLRVNSTFTPSAGESSGGIVFPPDPGGGGGDTAWMRYFSRGGESMTLEIGIQNDADDHISLMPSGSVGIGTRTPANKLDVIGDVALHGKHALRGSDGWLRLNQDGQFPAGTHTPNLFTALELNVCKPGGNWGYHPGPGNISYEGTLTKLDVGVAFAGIVRCADFFIGGHPGRRPQPGRALVDDTNTLVLNYGGDWASTRIDGKTSITQLVQPSSAALKEDIRPVSAAAAAAIVDALDPVSFHWKDDPAATHLGFVAEDCPQAVTTPEKDGIYLAHIVAALTRVVRDQADTIAALERRLGAIEEQP